MELYTEIAAEIENATWSSREPDFPGGPYKRVIFEDEIVDLAKRIAGVVETHLEREQEKELIVWQDVEKLEGTDMILRLFLSEMKFCLTPEQVYTKDQLKTLEQFRNFMFEHGLTNGDVEHLFIREWKEE